MENDRVVYLSLGSNLGDRAAYLYSAREMIDSVSGCLVTARSSVYESEAIDMSPGAGFFLNQALKLSCELRPEEALERLEEIERRLGRNLKGRPHCRTIDIDILLYGERVIETERLKTPHPRLHRRLFALRTLLELSPELVDPRNGTPYACYLKDLSQQHVKILREDARQL
ncbi:MAG: 2-amino-4-hydroxy-6-hydroxymethyldihydropteridine diphosphokinase [Candidatus Zixiibacteriota bacterium]